MKCVYGLCMACPCFYHGTNLTGDVFLVEDSGWFSKTLVSFTDGNVVACTTPLSSGDYFVL